MRPKTSKRLLRVGVRLLPLMLVCIPLLLGLGCSADDILGVNNKGELSGVVYDGADGGQTRLSGVRLSLVSRETDSNNQGEYKFTDIPVGTQTLTAYKTGFRTYSAQIQIREKDVDDPYANRHSFIMSRGGP